MYQATRRKEVLEDNMGDDGEFWMSFDDMKKHFTDFEICNVTIDHLEEDDNGMYTQCLLNPRNSIPIIVRE